MKTKVKKPKLVPSRLVYASLGRYIEGCKEMLAEYEPHYGKDKAMTRAYDIMEARLHTYETCVSLLEGKIV
jgi:hypothetical protein